RDEFFAGATLAFDEDVRVALRDLLEQAEEASHHDGSAVEHTEARTERHLRVFPRSQLPYAHDGFAERDAALRHREVRGEDLHASDGRTVQGAGVVDAPAGRGAREAAMEARHHRIGEHEIVALVRTEAAHLAFEDDDVVGRFASDGLYAELDARNGDRLAK